jgi:hypothetical protein
MKAKIITKNQIEDRNGKIFHNYKLLHESVYFWFSEKTFEDFPDLIDVKQEVIDFKEPVEEYFELEKKTNSKGEFWVIIPKSSADVSRVKEPEAIYETPKKTRKEIFFSSVKDEKRKAGLRKTESAKFNQYVVYSEPTEGTLKESPDLKENEKFNIDTFNENIKPIYSKKFEENKITEKLRGMFNARLLKLIQEGFQIKFLDHFFKEEFKEDIIKALKILKEAAIDFNKEFKLHERFNSILTKDEIDSILNYKDETIAKEKPESENVNQYIEDSEPGEKKIESPTEPNLQEESDLPDNKASIPKLNPEKIKKLKSKKTITILPESNLGMDDDVPALPKEPDLPEDFDFEDVASVVDAFESGKLKATLKKEKDFLGTFGTAKGVIAGKDFFNSPFAKKLSNYQNAPHSTESTPLHELSGHTPGDAAEKKDFTTEKRLAFISGLLQISNRKNVDQKTRQHMVGLIGKELEKNVKVKDEILQKIQQDVEQIKMFIGADYDYSQSTSEVKSESPVGSNKPAHKPRNTAKFLSNFKYDNDTGLKELVHRPNSKTMDTHELLEKIKKHPILSDEFGYGRIQGFEPINNWVRSETIKLLKQFEKNIKENTGDNYFHPFGINYDFTEKAKNFKRNYRFGPAGDDTYTCLRILIKGVVESCMNKLNYSIDFNPEENLFDMVSTFISWEPALEKGLMFIFNSLSDSTNIKGNKNFQETKKIQIRSTKDREREMVNVFIEDVDSIAKHDEKEILKFLRGSDPVTKNYFWGLCNWSVLLDNPNGSFELRILSDKVSEYKDEPIVKLDRKVNAFVHKLSFYNL